MGGRLFYYLQEWATQDLTNLHMKLLETGLSQNFMSLSLLAMSPKPVHLPKDSSRRSVLLTEVEALIQEQVLEQVTSLSPGFYSHLFTVPKKSGGFRPVTDLKALNRHIRSPHFHMETYQSITSEKGRQA